MTETGAPPGAGEPAGRAEVLIEALPYLQRFRDALVVVKYGGAAMIDEQLADSWARDVVLLEHVGLRPLVVHGGGPALTRTMKRMGIETKFIDGHRVTDADGAEIAEMVLSGRINKEVVSRLNRAGALAIGLSGTDAGMLRVRRHRPGGKDIGFVGQVEAVDTRPLRVLLDNDYLPVLSSTAADRDGQPHNINADLVAGAVAAAMSAEKLIFLTDTPGVLVDGRLQRVLSETEALDLVETGVATGGMMPKIEAALAALAVGVPRVHLVDGRLPHALLLEILTDRGVGTLLVLLFAVGWTLVAPRERSPGWPAEAVLLGLPFAALALVSSQTGMTHHVRYVFVVLPFAFVFVSRLFSAASRRSTRRIAGLLILLSLLESMAVWPRTISFFNMAVGGPARGHEHLIDSNLDWGQDLFLLAEWAKAHPEARPLHLAYFGSVDPLLLGIEYRLPPSGHPARTGDPAWVAAPAPGWHAVSASLLHGWRSLVPDGSGRFVPAGDKDFTWLLEHEPVARVGDSIFIYRVDAP